MELETARNILIVAAGLVTIALAGGAVRLLIMGRMRGYAGSANASLPAGDMVAELDALRARVEDLERRGLVSGEVESQYARLAELEERLDFAERLLAQRDAPARLHAEGPSS